MRRSSLLAAVAVALAAAPAAAQVAAGQVEHFEHGGTGGWIVGDPSHPAPPRNEATGGPAGAGDNYLRLQSTGGQGPGSRLSAYNVGAWAGDYLAAGIAGIRMDVVNLGPSDVTLRLLFASFGSQPGPPTDLAWSAEGVLVPMGSGWRSVFFPITPGALVVPVGTFAGALSGADELRLFHNPAPTFAGPGGNSSPAIAALVGIDNIAAVAVVPEPSALLLLATGAAATLALRGVSRRRR